MSIGGFETGAFVENSFPEVVQNGNKVKGTYAFGKGDEEIGDFTQATIVEDDARDNAHGDVIGVPASSAVFELELAGVTFYANYNPPPLPFPTGYIPGSAFGVSPLPPDNPSSWENEGFISGLLDFDFTPGQANGENRYWLIPNGGGFSYRGFFTGQSAPGYPSFTGGYVLMESGTYNVYQAFGGIQTDGPGFTCQAVSLGGTVVDITPPGAFVTPDPGGSPRQWGKHAGVFKSADVFGLLWFTLQISVSGLSYYTNPSSGVVSMSSGAWRVTLVRTGP